MKKIFFSSVVLFCLHSTVSAETINFDLSFKTGLTALNNDDGSNFNKGTFNLDAVFDLGYVIRPRVEVAYINVDEKTGSVKSLWQFAGGGQYEFALSDRYYVDPYLFAGLGYEYVDGSRKGFESQFFGQGGFGLKYPYSDKLTFLTEFKAIQIFDESKNDEKNEFALMIGAAMPFHTVEEVPDADQDGVLNANDLCPNTPVGVAVDVNGCALPVVQPQKEPCEVVVSEIVEPEPSPAVIDSDGDGVEDALDRCPNTPAGFEVNKVGCGIKKRLEVHFESNSAKLSPTSMQKIRAFANYLKRMPQVTVTIEGYTDSSGDPKKNMKLSQERANAVKKALIANGISTRRIVAIGKGELNPVADNETPEGRAKNRRIEAIIHQK